MNIRQQIGLIVGLIASFAQAYDVNKDLKNLGPAAYDLAVILSGPETVTGHYDGYPSGNFGSFSNGPSGLNHLLHWQNFWDGTDNIINPGQVIHVGWTTADHSSSVLDMYWTSQSGKRIPGSTIYNITSGWTYETSIRQCVAIWNHNLAQRDTVLISDMQFALSPIPYALADLNGQNPILAKSLRPLRDGYVTLEHGKSFTAPIPDSEHMSVVLVYNVTARSSAAQSKDFVQFQCVPGNTTSPDQ